MRFGLKLMIRNLIDHEFPKEDEACARRTA